MALLFAALTLVQTNVADQPPPFLQVTGNAMVATPPDRVEIGYSIAGEGKTPDDASLALAARQQAIADGLAGVLDGAAKVTTGNVELTEVRAPECDPSSYGNRPRISTGACAVIGYVATLQGTARTSAVAKAGTAVGLAVRLGARDARVRQFRLADPAAAMRRATAAAIADSRAKAEAMAAAAGVRLGAVLSVTDQNQQLIDSVNADDIGSMPGVARGRVSSAVAIPLSPEPIETRARIYVRFAVVR